MTQNLTNKTGSGPDRYKEVGPSSAKAAAGRHIPVLVDEVLEILQLQSGMTVIDGTVGAGGLSSRLAEMVGPKGRLIGIDRDPQMLEVARARLASYPQAVLEQAEFSRLREIAGRHEVAQVDAVVLDLGLNSLQLDDPARGFSFQRSGPLDMRMDQGEGRSAATIVNHTDELALSELIYRYGEERYARRIARAIVASRPLETTEELARVVERAVPRRGRIHPATRTFQALRIVVNDELGELERTLPEALALLAEGGRLAVISFHSLEDRIVKQFLGSEERGGRLRRLTRKPILAGPDEVAQNPRARSGKLRAAEKIGSQKEE
jgi:16S rRNA (cytosine1402-N4)-methyltransferase